MSAFVVDKKHIDLMVCAAEHYGRQGYQGSKMQWWQVDEDGEYAGWRYLYANEDERDEYYTPSQLGQILVNENIASVVGRYPDCDADMGDLPGPCDAYYMGPYVYENPGRVLSPGEVFRAIDCLDYQSCEHDGWRKSEAFAFLTSFRQSVCRFVADAESAAWELTA
jgi:hypothetical protein